MRAGKCSLRSPRSLDAASQYYFGEGDIGKPRDACSVPQLAELNTYVQVGVLPEGKLSEGVLDRFHVVLFTNTPAAELAKYNAYCRSKSPAIGFIAADVRGVAGRAFVGGFWSFLLVSDLFS